MSILDHIRKQASVCDCVVFRNLTARNGPNQGFCPSDPVPTCGIISSVIRKVFWRFAVVPHLKQLLFLIKQDRAVELEPPPFPRELCLYEGICRVFFCRMNCEAGILRFTN